MIKLIDQYNSPSRIYYIGEYVFNLADCMCSFSDCSSCLLNRYCNSLGYMSCCSVYVCSIFKSIGIDKEQISTAELYDHTNKVYMNERAVSDFIAGNKNRLNLKDVKFDFDSTCPYSNNDCKHPGRCLKHFLGMK